MPSLRESIIIRSDTAKAVIIEKQEFVYVKACYSGVAAQGDNDKKYLGKSYDVTASVGHIRDLPAAKLSVDIKNDFAPKYAIVKGKEKLVKELKEKPQTQMRFCSQPTPTERERLFPGILPRFSGCRLMKRTELNLTR